MVPENRVWDWVFGLKAPPFSGPFLLKIILPLCARATLTPHPTIPSVSEDRLFCPPPHNCLAPRSSPRLRRMLNSRSKGFRPLFEGHFLPLTFCPRHLSFLPPLFFLFLFFSVVVTDRAALDARETAREDYVCQFWRYVPLRLT